MESSIDPLRGDICASRNLYNDFRGRGGKIDVQSGMRRNSRSYGSQDVLEYSRSAFEAFEVRSIFIEYFTII